MVSLLHQTPIFELLMARLVGMNTKRAHATMELDYLLKDC